MIRGRMIFWTNAADALRRAALTAAFAATTSAPLAAADLIKKIPTKAVPAPSLYDWSGLFVGGHVGYGGGSLGAGTHPALDQAVILPSTITGLFGGFQAGYRTQLPNRLVLGIEGDVSFSNAIDPTRPRPEPFETAFDAVGTVRGVAGYAVGNWLPYVAAGFAWGRTHLALDDANGNRVQERSHLHLGWTAGAGIEFAIAGPWSGRIDYQYVDLASHGFLNETIAPPLTSVDPHLHMIKAGLNFRPFATASTDGPVFAKPNTESSTWNVHVQSTFIEQAYPNFRSPYQGANSLPGTGQGRETWTATAFLGWRLWQGGEIYFNPELAQGFGLNGTLGLAGFSNGEAQKGGAPVPRMRAQRYFVRQTFGLGGEQEDVADGPNQLAGKRDIDRVTVTIGRFAVGDFFDGNSYAKDPRADFMNWALWAAAAYDFPADLPGFTRGAVVELNRKDWAVRAGYFQVPSVPNSDILTFNTGGVVAEFEERHKMFDQPGKLRLGVFANRGNVGIFRDAISIAAADPALDINDVMATIRKQNLKYGVYANLEQQVAADVGVFARASWNNGHTETENFTQVDRSLSGGVSIKGASWGRADDTIGIGAAINGLSRDHRDFLAAGGTGIIIGDGRLNYRPEQIVEAYYAWAIRQGVVWSFDYQFVANPAYNADRGPVSIFATRVHAEW